MKFFQWVMRVCFDSVFIVVMVAMMLLILPFLMISSGCSTIVNFGEKAIITTEIDTPYSTHQEAETANVVGGDLDTIRREIKDVERDVIEQQAKAEHLDRRIDRGKERGEKDRDMFREVEKEVDSVKDIVDDN